MVAPDPTRYTMSSGGLEEQCQNGCGAVVVVVTRTLNLTRRPINESVVDKFPSNEACGRRSSVVAESSDGGRGLTVLAIVMPE